MSTYRLFPSTSGPSFATTYSNPFLAGVAFKVTQPTLYLAGYYWWVCSGGSPAQPTGAQKFALWNDGGGTQSLQGVISAATITSSTLTAGQWNYVPLTTPIPLTENQVYIAATGFTGSFPITNNQFGSGDPYAAGITDGPLFAFSDLSGSAPAPISLNQGLFGTPANNDPTLTMPGSGSNSCNLWIDLEITNVVPSNATYRLFPSLPAPFNISGSSSGNYTLTVEFELSQPCIIDKLWMYSGSGCTALPTHCGIFSVSSQTEVSGSDNSSPSWLSAPDTAATAGAGWCYADYSSAHLTLPAGSYRAAIFSTGASPWFSYSDAYWGTSGPGSLGAANGPISAPSNAAADTPGQGGSLAGSWGYPTSASADNSFWIDVEVTPATTSSGALLAMFV